LNECFALKKLLKPTILFAVHSSVGVHYLLNSVENRRTHLEGIQPNSNAKMEAAKHEKCSLISFFW